MPKLYPVEYFRQEGEHEEQPSKYKVVATALSQRRTRNLVISDFFGNQRFTVRVRLLALCSGELFAVITWLTSKCLCSGWKWLRGVKEIASSFPCCPVSHECSSKKTQIEKKRKNVGRLVVSTLSIC